MDSSEALKQFDQKFNELKKSLEINHNNNNKCYVLFDLRMKALCGVYLNENDVLDVIDKKHREDIKIEMDALRLKILNGEDQEYNSMNLYCLETQVKNMGANHKITGYSLSLMNKSNYCYYTVPFNDFEKRIIAFTNSKPENRK